MTRRYHINLRSAVMIIVDPQRAFGEVIAVEHVATASAKIQQVALAWRAAGGHAILTRHVYRSANQVGRTADFFPHVGSLLAHDSPYAELHAGVATLAPEVLEKTEYSAVVRTDLVDRLRRRAADTVVLCGLTTPICVQATADGLHMAGFKVVIVGDACASQTVGDFPAALAHEMALERLRYAVAEVVTTDDMLDLLSSTAGREDASTS